MRRATVVLAVPALVCAMLLGGAATASADRGSGVVSLLGPPKCC